LRLDFEKGPIHPSPLGPSILTAGRRGGTLAGGLAAASRSYGVVRDLEGGTGEVPGKEERVGAHRNGVLTVRRCKRRRAAEFNGGGVAPMVIGEHGEVLQLKGDPGVRRRRSIEEWSSSEGAHRRRGWTVVARG
jgi:hypothetical protein